jgi:hypothetical protein
MSRPSSSCTDAPLRVAPWYMVCRPRLPSLACDLVIPQRSFSHAAPCLLLILPAVPLALVVTALPHRAIPWWLRIVNTLPFLVCIYSTISSFGVSLAWPWHSLYHDSCRDVTLPQFPCSPFMMCLYFLAFHIPMRMPEPRHALKSDKSDCDRHSRLLALAYTNRLAISVPHPT